MNFTGKVQRPRNINLGGKSVSGTSRDSLLKRAQVEREKRELVRKRENAAIVIQAFYRAKTQVTNIKSTVLNHWLESYSSDYQFQSLKDAESYIRQISFGLSWRVATELKRDAITCLTSVLCREDNWTYVLEISRSNPFLLNQFASKMTDQPAETGVLLLLTRLYDIASIEIRVLIIHSVASCESARLDKNDQELIDLMLRKISLDSPGMVIGKVLSDPYIFDRRDTKLFKPVIDCQGIENALMDISDKGKLASLSNVIYLISLDGGSYGKHLPLIHSLLAQIHSHVEVLDGPNGKTSDSDEDNDISTDLGDQPCTHIVLSVDTDRFILQQISKLYTKEVLASFFEYYISQQGSKSVSSLATVLAEMIRIFPQKRKDIMLHLSVSFDVPAVHMFWQSFKESSCFKVLAKAAPNASVLADILSVKVTEWAKFQLVLDLYSYWLIVADDDEFSRNTVQGLAKNELHELCTILKHLCFSLIWHWPKVESKSLAISMKQVQKLKSLSILVLRQIYVRDSRRPFLPAGFWLMTNSIDMERFIPQVVEEEERLMHEDSEDMEQHSSQSKEHTPRRRDLSSRQNVVAPRLEILRQVPFFMPFKLRVHIFHEFIARDKQRQEANTHRDFFSFTPDSRLEGTVRREHLLQDAFDAFRSKSAGSTMLKDRIRVTFYSNGLPEAGIDGGGLTKELLTSVCKEGFDVSKGLFCSTNDHRLYPNPVYGVSHKDSALSEAEVIEGLQYMEFLGEIIGKCLYDETLVDVDFAPFFLQKWAGRASKNSFDDLYSLDPDIYKNLVVIRNYNGDVESDLGLNFALTQDVGHGEQKSIELVHGGEDKAVTNTNKLEYIHAVAHYKLNVTLAKQTSAFLTGVNKLISLQWLSMFNSTELQMLISGGSAQIDLQDLYNNTEYGGYGPGSPTVTAFWETLHELSDEDKRNFVKFVTSVPKAPLLGFSQLSPKFGIRNAGQETERLPTASTCVNLLKLPDYKSKTLLKEKLIYAIRAEAGFDLS